MFQRRAEVQQLVHRDPQHPGQRAQHGHVRHGGVAPYGLIGGERSQLIRTPMIYWSVDPQDWKLLDKDKVVAAVLEDVEPGDIILLHDFYSTSGRWSPTCSPPRW